MKKNKKIPCYTVKVSYSVVTKKQAIELTKALRKTYADLVSAWTKVKLPKTWGTILVDGERVKF